MYLGIINKMSLVLNATNMHPAVKIFEFLGVKRLKISGLL